MSETENCFPLIFMTEICFPAVIHVHVCTQYAFFQIQPTLNLASRVTVCADWNRINQQTKSNMIKNSRGKYILQILTKIISVVIFRSHGSRSTLKPGKDTGR